MLGGVPAELEVQYHWVSVLRLYVVAPLQVDLPYLPQCFSRADLQPTDIVLVLPLTVRTLLFLLGEQTVDFSDFDLEADAFLLFAFDLEYFFGKGV